MSDRSPFGWVNRLANPVVLAVLRFPPHGAVASQDTDGEVLVRIDLDPV